MSIWQRIKETPLIRIFSITILISFCVWIWLLLTGRTDTSVFFGLKEPCDSLFDDYKCLTSAVYNFLQFETLYPWAKGDYSYPPSGYLFCAFWGNVINAINPKDISSSELLFASLYLTFCVSSLFMLIFNFAKNITKFDRYLFCMAIFSSGIFLFSYERANMIFITFLFLTYFIFYYDSKNKILKEIALIALASAISFKLSPAIFGMLLVWNKDFKAIFRLIFYSIFLFVAPALFYPGGIEVIKLFFENILLQSNIIIGSFSTPALGKSFINNFVINNFGGTMYEINKFTTFWISIIGLLGLLTTFFFNEKWKKMFILAFLMVVIPSLSYGYVLLYFIPVMLFYFMEEKHSKSDLLFMLWFIIIFATGTLSQRGADVYYNVQELGLWGGFLQIFGYGIAMTIKNFKPVFVEGLVKRKLFLINAIKKSEKQKECVKLKIKQFFKFTGLSASILVIGVYLYGINYTFWEKSFKDVSSPITINCKKSEIKDDFRLSINTTFFAKQTNKEQILFQTDKDNKGIQLKQHPDLTLTLEYPLAKDVTERYTFGKKLINNALYNVAIEITNQSVSPLLSNFNYKKNAWQSYKEIPYKKKIDKNAISSEIVINGSTERHFEGKILDFYILYKNGNNTNYLVILVLLGTFLPLFMIAYNRNLRKFIKKIDNK